MVALALTSRTQTTVTIAQSAITAGTTNIEWQYATRQDFQFCIAPVISVGTGASVTIGSLNRAQTYWIRAREISAAGTGAWGAPIGVTTVTGADSSYTPSVQIQPALIVVPQTPTQWIGQGAIAGYPAANMGVPSPAAAHRVGLTLAQYEFAIETNGQPIDTIALLDTNIPEGATARFFGGSTANKALGFTTPDSQTSQVAFRASSNLRGRRGYHGLFRLATPITDRFVGVYIETDSPPGNIVHITHAVFGQARVLKNYSDMTDQPMDLGTFDRLRDGTPDSVAGFRMRKVDFTVSVMTETQHETAFADLGQLVGTNEPVLVVPNSKSGPYLHDRLLYGNITQSRQSNANMRFERSLTIESIIN